MMIIFIYYYIRKRSEHM